MKFDTVTIKDIAKELNLSTSTVSRALRGSYEISPETKKLVIEYAEKINYRPKPIALSLKERRSRAIGVVVSEIANNFFSQAINGIESIAYNRGYHVIITQAHESREREIVNVQHLASRSVDGLLVSIGSGSENISHFKELHDKGLPIVFFECLDGYEEDLLQRKLDLLSPFTRAMDHYQQQQFDAALELFQHVLEKDPEDHASLLFRENAVRFAVHGVPEDWSGAERMSSK